MLKEILNQGRAAADAALELLLPPATQHPTSIHQAMRHSVFAGGKRLRPILCMEAGRMIAAVSLARESGVASLASSPCYASEALGDIAPLPAGIENLGAALEMLHTYSLIHDDLPALDNDDLRRGRPTCHKAYGEATAILAGDALLTLAFDVLARDMRPASAAAAGCALLAQAAGATQLVGGQADDLLGASTHAGLDALESIHRRKTGALFLVSLQLG